MFFQSNQPHFIMTPLHNDLHTEGPLWPESPCQLPCAPLPLYMKPDMIHLYSVALDTVQCIQ